MGFCLLHFSFQVLKKGSKVVSGMGERGTIFFVFCRWGHLHVLLSFMHEFCFFGR